MNPQTFFDGLLRVLMLPVALLYGLLVLLRNGLYRVGMLKSVRYDLPIISVGNLSTGGTGKTPHIEYLLRLLKDYINVATLSRGYGRKTNGFLIVHRSNTAAEVGDEPLLFKRKHPDVMVAVGENRVLAVPRMLMAEQDLQCILLDDAFQHRAITPGLNILLTTYDAPFTRDFLLPAGRLREWPMAYTRADIIVVTKCPPDITEADRQRLAASIRPQPHQSLFFSGFTYGHPYFWRQPDNVLPLHDGLDVLLVCAIARPDDLIRYLQERVKSLAILDFEDHHYFDANEMEQMAAAFGRIPGTEKAIITTEKDIMRLRLHKRFLINRDLPVYVLPVEVQFLFGQGGDFDGRIRQFLLDFRA